MADRKHVFTAVNIASLIILGLVLQLGGAYLVNAAVIILEKGDGAAASAAVQYSGYMNYIRSFEPRQMMHAIFVAPLVEELVFRLIFLRAGRMVMPFWLANIVQAGLFAFYHGTSFQRVYGFIMGLLIGCVFYYCPVIYRSRYAADDKDAQKDLTKSSAYNRGLEKKGKTLGKDRGNLLDLPNSLLGFALTFILHMVINASGIFIVPLFPADPPIALQIVAGTLLMLIGTCACVWLWKQACGGVLLRRQDDKRTSDR